jgi:flagellar basal-body rod protein FlgC
MTITTMMNTAITGMRTQTSRLGEVADNIANLDTPAYPNVDSLAEITDMMEARTAFEANAAVFEAGADLWDVIATMKRD